MRWKRRHKEQATKDTNEASDVEILRRTSQWMFRRIDVNGRVKELPLLGKYRKIVTQKHSQL